VNAEREDVLGYQVNVDGVTSSVESVVRWVESGNHTRWLACLNPHSYVLALKDKTFSDALHAADWLVPDGVGIVLASRCLRGRIRERVTGSDVFWGVQRTLNRSGQAAVFFLGSTEETLRQISTRTREEFSRLRVVGTYSPPFTATYSTKENEAMLAAVNAAAPDVLWVGITAPKQEKWIFQNKERLKVKFAAAVGAVFDFYSGRVRRSDPMYQKLGLEWLPRLLQEPRRLWPRMFISAPLFAWHVLSQRIGHRYRRKI
jgi:N-acetylglucosaminyldiphosphoundecaprenol N-acetyl-beta-D-mannosaminyltransferase